MPRIALAGIDVGSRELVISMESPAGRITPLRFPNTPAGHKHLCARLTRGGRPARACMEATGVYGFELALALHQAKGVQVMVANPAAVRDFSRAFLKRSKTDAVDAATILEFLRRMPFLPWHPPDPEVLDLQALARRIAAIKITHTQETNRLHASDHYADLTPAIAEDIETHLDHLKLSIRHLTQEAVRVIRSHSGLSQKFDRLVSVRGIAEISAVRILAELATLPEEMTSRQWVAHAGLDPRQFESGTSIRKPGRISKKGNRHLRAALYMPALVAIQKEPHIQAFYEKLLHRGKKPMQAIVAVMRKLLHAIHGMLHTNTNFNGEKFYALNT